MPQAYRHTEVKSLWDSTKKDFTRSRQRISTVRKWLAGDVDPVLPDKFTADANLKDLAVKLPHSITMPLHTVQVLARKRPQLIRDLIGGKGIAAMRKSTQVQRWANGALAEIEDQAGPIWQPLIAGLLQQAELAVLAYPTPAGWEEFPEFRETLPTDVFQGLPEEEQADFDEDGDGYSRVRPMFQRDSAGRDREDEYFTEPGKRRQPFKVDNKQSAAAFDEYQSDFKARRIPLTVRVVTAEQCLPLFGPGFRLDGLLIRSQYSESALHQKGYRWLGGNGSPGLGRSEERYSASGLTKSCTLTELWTPGNVCYYVGDASGTLYETSKVRGGEDEVAEVDLAGEYGLSRLLAHYQYGMHRAEEEDPDQRGIPFLHPFLSAYAGANNLATAAAVHAWKWAFMGPGVIPGENVDPALLMEDGKPKSFKLEPWEITLLPGPVQAMSNFGVAPDVDKLMNLLMGATREEGSSAGAFGGPGPQSGHDRSLLRAHLEDALSLVPEGALESWEWLGEALLESGTALVGKSGHVLPVYVAAPLEGERSSRRDHVDLTKDLCDGAYDLHAEYPNAPGENLPYAQMLAEWSLKELVPQRYFMENGLGEQSPEDLMVEIQVERMLFKTPEGQAYIQQLAAEEIQDDRWKEMQALVQGGRATPDGTPTAALGGVAPQGPPLGPGGPPPQQGTLAGTAMPNPVNSAVGGIVAGGIGTQNAVRDAAAGAGHGI